MDSFLFILVSSLVALCLWPLMAIVHHALKPRGRVAIAIFFLSTLLPLLAALIVTGILPVRLSAPASNQSPQRAIDRDDNVSFLRVTMVDSAPFYQYIKSRTEQLVNQNGKNTRSGIFELIFIFYLASVAVAICRPFVVTLKLRREAKRLTLPVSEELVTQLECCKQKLCLSDTIELVVSRSVGAPAIFGFLRPFIVLPEVSLEWSYSEVEYAMLHELAHLKHKDCLVVLVQYILAVPLFFHPFFIWIRRRLRLEIEKRADGIVLHNGTLASQYALFLLKLSVLGVSLTHNIALYINGQFQNRIKHIIDFRRSSMSQRKINLASIALAVFISLITIWIAVPIAKADDIAPVAAVDTQKDYEIVSPIADMIGPVKSITFETTEGNRTFHDALAISVREPIIDVRLMPFHTSEDKLETTIAVALHESMLIISGMTDVARFTDNSTVVMRLTPGTASERFVVFFGDSESLRTQDMIEEMLSSEPSVRPASMRQVYRTTGVITIEGTVALTMTGTITMNGKVTTMAGVELHSKIYSQSQSGTNND